MSTNSDRYKKVVNNKLEKNLFTLSDDTVIKLRPVSKFMIDDLLSTRQSPKPPSYTVELADGSKQEYEHDETTITDADREVWEKYLLDSKVEDTEFTMRFLKLLLLEGVEINEDISGNDATWIRKRTYLGLNTPEDEFERMFFYITRVLARSETDIADLIAGILQVGGASREAVDSVKKSFRASIQENTDREVSEVEERLDDTL